MYLLKSTVGREMRQFLVLLCEVHVALLYLIQLDPIFDYLEHNGKIAELVLSQLGVPNHGGSWEFLSIVLLLCFSTIQNHGLEVLLSLDAILQHASQPPVGFGMTKSRHSKLVLLILYLSQNFKYSGQGNISQEYAWSIESRGEQTAGLALRAIYLTKAVSLALQALQIRFGLPHKSTLYGQFLTSRVTNPNYLGFRLYRALPFLYELRCVLDWSCTATSLTMYDWLKLEDIYASLYLVKCDISLSRTKYPLGQKQSKATKFWNGICLFLLLICVIWAPMLIYSSGNPTNIANPVKDVSTQIDIKTRGGRLTLYQTTLCECYFWEDLLDAGFKVDPNLKPYDVQDIQLICCQADANTLWAVPASALKSFMKSVNEEMDVISTWKFTRDRPKGKEVVNYNSIKSDHSSPSLLVDILNGSSDVLKLFGLYPRYFRITGSGEVHMLDQVEEMVSGDLVMNRDASSWWSFYPNNASDLRGCGSLTGPTAIVVSEETPQGFIGETLSKFSIWSLYITFVLAVGRFIRLQCSDLRMRIPYENFPSCDRLIAICEDIYAARAEGELKLEELLFGTLVNIYRSPNALLEYTKCD